jgi:protein TonB
LSLLVHGALAAGLGTIRAEQSRAATAIAIAEVKKKPAPPPPAAIDPEPPPKVKQRAVAARQAPRAETPPPQAPPPTAATPLAGLPDLGVSLSGGVTGSGVSLPVGGTPRGAVRSTQGVAGPSMARNALPAADACAEPLTKPKPKSVPQPAYPEAARAAGVEGKVRVELTVDETGRVISVRVLQGLGHGLDEAALSAARQASFEPALRCGKPARATFTISMRFTAT